MLKRVLQGLVIICLGPLVGFWVAFSTFTRGGDVGMSTIITLLFAAWLMLGLPILGLKMMWWGGRTAGERWIEREVDVRFEQRRGYRNQRTVRSW